MDAKRKDTLSEDVASADPVELHRKATNAVLAGMFACALKSTDMGSLPDALRALKECDPRRT